MPRLTPQHYRILIKIFEKVGFTVKRTRGSHIVMNKPGVERPIVIPKYEEVDVDIIKANLRTAQLSREEYFKLLEDSVTDKSAIRLSHPHQWIHCGMSDRLKMMQPFLK